MMKIATLIIAITFTLSIALAVINTAATNNSVDAKNSYAAICPLPPPPKPSERDK